MPLALEFQGGLLVKINGHRPEYMDGHTLLKVLRELAVEVDAHRKQELETERLMALLDTMMHGERTAGVDDLADLVRPAEILRLDNNLLRVTLEDAVTNGLAAWLPADERSRKRRDALLGRIRKVLEGKR